MQCKEREGLTDLFVEVFVVGYKKGAHVLGVGHPQRQRSVVCKSLCEGSHTTRASGAP